MRPSPTQSDLPRRLRFSDPLHIAFQGFSDRTFALLDRLRATPTVRCYQDLKEELDRWVKKPLSAYRDDLVVNWVLPNELPFETERNVFSRFPKNDFGAGGSNSHLWLSFYRTGSSRLQDFQVVHSISTSGFVVGLYVSDRMKASFAVFKELVERRSPALEQQLRSLVASPDLNVELESGSRREAVRMSCFADYDELARARGLWASGRFPRKEVLSLGSDLVGRALAIVGHVWPLYRLLASRAAV